MCCWDADISTFFEFAATSEQQISGSMPMSMRKL